jgi:hypothetical protein
MIKNREKLEFSVDWSRKKGKAIEICGKFPICGRAANREIWLTEQGIQIAETGNSFRRNREGNRGCDGLKRCQ